MPTFQIAGHSVEFKADTVRQRLRGVGPEKIQVWGVEIDGRMYPVVQALEAASGVPRGVTRSARARSVLGALGLPGDAIGPVSAAARKRVAFS